MMKKYDLFYKYNNPEISESKFGEYVKFNMLKNFYKKLEIQYLINFILFMFLISVVKMNY